MIASKWDQLLIDLGIDFDREVSPRRRFRVAASNLFRCRYCGSFVVPFYDGYRRVRKVAWFRMNLNPLSGRVPGEVDHIVAVSDGGGNWRNLAWSCRPCNRAKSGRPPIGEWKPRPLPWYGHIASLVLLFLLVDFEPDDLYGSTIDADVVEGKRV